MKRLLCALVLLAGISLLVPLWAADDLSTLQSDPGKYVRAVSDMVTQAIGQGDLDGALGLLDLFSAYPLCPEVSTCRFKLAEKLKEQGRLDSVIDLLQANVDQDPYSREAPQSMEMLGDILEAGNRSGEAYDLWMKLAVNYYPAIPGVMKARARLGNAAPVIRTNKLILLDSSLGESRIYDRCATGSCNFGQLEVAQTLTDAGFTVHSNDITPKQQLTGEVMAFYGLILMNTPYSGSDERPIPENTIDDLAAYVKSGGNLLVIGLGSIVGNVKTARYYNPLLERFGLGFEEGATIATEKGKSSVFADFIAPYGVPVKGGKTLAYCGEEPVITATEYGKGKVIAAGLGWGLTGNHMCPGQGLKSAGTDKRLLVQLASYLLTGQ